MSALPTASAVPAASRPITPAGAALRRAASLLIAHGILIAGAVFILLPFVWMLVTSIKPPAEIFAVDFSLWPKQLQRRARTTASRSRTAPLLRFALNGLDRLRRHPRRAGAGRRALRVRARQAALSGPHAAVRAGADGLVHPDPGARAAAVHGARASWALLNTYFAIMMPFFLSVFAIFLFRQFFKGYPDEIIHAARLDGMGEFEIVWRIVVPSAWPAIAAFAVFSFIAHWNDLYWPLIVVSDRNLATPPLGMMFFADAETGSNYGVLTAAATVLTAPLVIAFLVARRRFIEGITMTGIK